MDKLLFKVYADETAEFLQLAAGELDFTDWALTAAFLDTSPGKTCATDNSFPLCPNIGLTSPVTQLDMFNFEFNVNNTWWGIDMQNGRNPDGVQIRQAVSHILDKDPLIATDPDIRGLATKIDNPVSPAQPVNLPDFKLFDSLHPNTISAYNIATDPTGFAELGSADWLAALDHLAKVKDNPATPGCDFWCDTNGDKVIDTNRPTTPVEFFCRIDSKPRDRMCNGIASRLNQMFGTAVVHVNEKTISQVNSIVFSTSKPDDWNAYSAGYGVNPDPDQIYDFYASVFASDVCGGPTANFASNYDFICDNGNDIAQAGQPGVDLREVSAGYFININENDYDALAFKSRFAATLADSKTAATQALLRFGQMAFSIPYFADAAPFAYLKDPLVGGLKADSKSTPDGNPWTGIINVKGFGPIGIDLAYASPSWRNAYTSQPALPGTMRIGMKQAILHTDPFKSQTLWEFMILSPLYGSLVELSPYDPNQLMSSIANSWTENITPTELGYNPDTVLGVAPGTVKSSIRFNLRTDVFFHDGNQLSAEDVEFSLEQFKAQAAALFLTNVQSVIGVTCGVKRSCIDLPTGDDDARDEKLDFTADVHFNQVSFNFIKGVGALAPIIPKHVWDSNHDGQVDSTKLGNAFDGMKNHALIGSGDWVCRDLVTRVVGGGCTSTGSSSADVGDSVVMERYKADPLDPRKQYPKSVANFKEWNYADGSIQAQTGNPLADDQVVDFFDANSILLCFGQNTATGHPECQYWNDAAPVPSNPDPTVDIVEVGIVTRWFGTGQFDQNVLGTRWTFPLLWDQYLNPQPFPPSFPSISP